MWFGWYLKMYFHAHWQFPLSTWYMQEVSQMHVFRMCTRKEMTNLIVDYQSYKGKWLMWKLGMLLSQTNRYPTLQQIDSLFISCHSDLSKSWCCKQWVCEMLLVQCSEIFWKELQRPRSIGLVKNVWAILLLSWLERVDNSAQHTRQGNCKLLQRRNLVQTRLEIGRQAEHPKIQRNLDAVATFTSSVANRNAHIDGGHHSFCSSLYLRISFSTRATSSGRSTPCGDSSTTTHFIRYPCSSTLRCSRSSINIHGVGSSLQ